MAGKKKKTRKMMLVALLLMLLFTAGAFFYMFKNETFNRFGLTEKNAEPELFTWIVDWEWEFGIIDLQQLASGLHGLQLFAGYFDENDQLYFTPEMMEALPKIIGTEAAQNLNYIGLTLVNDRMKQDGEAIQKDASLITRIVATEKSRSKHITEVINVVEQYNINGVEIDYERVKDSDWEGLTLLFQELYDQLKQRGKSLRIVLEPQAPVETLSLPEGPVYVMMAYNLYGTHSGPGPKADDELIYTLAEKMHAVPGQVAIALSAGGFDWSESGDIVAITEQQAKELSERSLHPPQRDQSSGSITFEYQDVMGIEHTVWYADAQTLSRWINVANEAGIAKIALWRLGGLKQETLEYFTEQYS